MKRIISVLLCAILISSLLPTTIYALPGDGGYPGLTGNTPNSEFEIDGQNVLVYVTSVGGYVSRTSGADGDSSQQYTVTADDNWEFLQWLTYYEGTVVNSSNWQFALSDDYYFSAPGNSETAYTKTNKTIQINNEWDATGTYYLYAIFRPKLSVVTDLDTTVSFWCERTTQDSVFSSGTGTTETAVPYEGTAKIQASLNDRVVKDVYIDHMATSSYEIRNGWIYLNEFVVTRPTKVTISTRAKIQNVIFDANGGSGTMSTQVFNAGEARALTNNSFEREDYAFTGWNTQSDGLGTAYADAQSVTFTPATDGENVTLYAQWEMLPVPVFTAPTVKNLTYSGQPQNLVEAGDSSDGTMWYSLEENGTYTVNVPQATNADTYKVWYYVEGDDNHIDSGKNYVEVKISKADPEIGVVSAGVLNDTTDISAVILGREDETVPGSLLIDENQSLKFGNNEITYTFIPEDTYNYNVANGSANVMVKDTVSPTGTVTIQGVDSIWNTILETITFKRFFNRDCEVVVEAADTLSGVEKVEYYETSDTFDLEGIAALKDEMWTEMDKSIVVKAEDSKKFIFYIRITDKAGNKGYIATDGTEFDTKAPEISGVKDGETYYKTQKINVKDKNLDTVTLNGKTVEDTFTIEGNKKASYIIIATDKAGNSVTVKVKTDKVSDAGVKGNDDSKGDAGDDGNVDSTDDDNANGVRTTPSALPKTGDDANIWLWIINLWISGGCFVGAIIYEKKKRKTE